MNRKIILFLIVVLIGFQITFAQKSVKYIEKQFLPIICLASEKIEKSFIPPPADILLKSAAEKESDIVITYSLFPEKAKIAFEYAVNIWEHIVQSDVPIHIEANWRTQEKNILGSAGPAFYYTNFERIPHQNRYYPVAVAERITKTDLNGSTDPDIVSTFNKDIEWYYGTDGNTPDSLYDFVTVVLHEIAHGLGFTGFFYTTDDLGLYAFNDIGEASAFDLLVVNNDNNALVDTTFFQVPSAELKNSFTSGELFAESPVAITLSKGIKPRLYSPNNFDEGSSIYHIDDSAHPNDLMNHAIGKSEAVHDPGLLVTGILEDIGWKTMFLDLDKPKDLEEKKEITFNVNIESDYPLDINSLYIFYSTDIFENNKDSVQLLPTNTLNLFSAKLTPPFDVVEIYYYAEAVDSMNRVFRMPNEAPKELYTIKIGPDHELPVILHDPIPYHFLLQDELKVLTSVDDNIGVDTVFVEYTINGEQQSTFGLKPDSLNIYSGTFNFNKQQLKDGDEIAYKIIAIDSAIAENTAKFPFKDALTFKIENVFESLSQYYNDFNSDLNEFIINDFDIYTESNFEDGALHSPHPYPSPNLNNTYWNFQTILKHPLILTENGKMSFDEVVLVEPGEFQASYGDDDFWDYVIVEGSKDSCETWLQIDDGYDSGSNSFWQTKYNENIVDNESLAVGDSEYYINREINLTENENFEAGDTIIIRFRLHSDPYANGWGWAIDNLKIQIPVSLQINTLSKGNIQVYPNPFNNAFNISVQANNQIEELSIEVFNLFGQKIMIKKLKNAIGEITQNINLANKPAGMYFILVKENGNKVYSRKIIKE